MNIAFQQMPSLLQIWEHDMLGYCYVGLLRSITTSLQAQWRALFNGQDCPAQWTVWFDDIFLFKHNEQRKLFWTIFKESCVYNFIQQTINYLQQ